MKKLLFGLSVLLPVFATAATVDCSSPRYANPALKQYCLSLEKSAASTIRSTDEKFSKNFSKYQLQLETEIAGGETDAQDATTQQPSTATGNNNPNNPPQQPTVPPAPNYTAPPATPVPVPEETTVTPTPSGKPRRYY